jgi:hypothetical protein
MTYILYVIPVKVMKACEEVEVESSSFLAFGTKWTLVVKFMPVSFTSANAFHHQLNVINNDWLL